MIYLLQIDHCRESVELFEHVIRTLVVNHPGHGPLFVCRITERDRARRTSLGASGSELVSLDSAMLERRAIFSLANSLHAERTFLHDALATNSDVGVELPVERLGERVLRP